MYHKRLKGYAELGYQVKLTGKDAESSKIYDSRTYLEPFLEDLRDAAESISIVSPFLRMSRLQMMLPLLERAVQSGVRVTVRTRMEGEESAVLEGVGATVERQVELHRSYAVIDRAIVWYGNIMYLSYNSGEANALRFENADIAGEVLELEKHDDLPEQLRIEG